MTHHHPSFYRPDIDGLRGIAVLMVVLFHAGLGFKGGYVGVDIFFVISGYLITGLLFKEMAARGTIDLAGFWERRIRRIAPALTAMILITLGAGYLLLFPDAFASLGESAIAQALFCANLYFWKDSGYFAAASEEKPLLHLWSLAVEEQFYIVLPVVLWLGHLWLKKRHPQRSTKKPLVIAMTGVLGLSLVASIIGLQTDANATFYWLPTRAWELLVGSVLAGLPTRWNFSKRIHREIAAGVSLILIFIAALAYKSDTPFPGAAALLPCLGAAGLIWAHGPGADLSPRTWALLTWRPLVGVGLLSYSLYLWHWPLLALAQYVTVSGRPSSGVRVGLVLLAFLLAWLSWRWVETPFRQKAFLKKRRQVFAFGLGTMALFLITGGLLVREAGLPGRIPQAALKYAEGQDDKMGDSLQWAGLEAVQRGEFPRLGEAESAAPVQLMIWGDSHARALIPLLDPLCLEHDVSGEAAIYSATSPTLGFYRRSRHGLNEKSELLGQAMLAEVRQKQIPHTLLAAYWKECPGKQPQAFADALVTTVKTLKAAGTQPWVVLDVPDQDFDVPKALALEHLPQGWFPQASKLAISLAEHRKANAVMENLRPRLIEAGARILDPMDVLTGPDGTTRIEADGASLYTDSHHLSITGVRLLKPLFEPLMADLTVGEKQAR